MPPHLWYKGLWVSVILLKEYIFAQVKISMFPHIYICTKKDNYVVDYKMNKNAICNCGGPITYVVIMKQGMIYVEDVKNEFS